MARWGACRWDNRARSPARGTPGRTAPGTPAAGKFRTRTRGVRAFSIGFPWIERLGPREAGFRRRNVSRRPGLFRRAADDVDPVAARAAPVRAGIGGFLRRAAVWTAILFHVSSPFW